MEQEAIIGDTVRAYGAVSGTGVVIAIPLRHFSMRQTKVYMIYIQNRCVSYTYEHIFPFANHVLTEKTLSEFKKGTIETFF